MSRKSEAVKKWRENTKMKIVQAMGGCCQICKYDKCYAALDLHHIDPTKKEFGLGGIRANPKSWIKIAEECKKCILLCNRCHMEFHHGFVDLPEKYQMFDDSLIVKLDKQKTYCPVCGDEKEAQNKTCSYSCASTLSGKVDWDNIDLEKKLETQTINSIAEELDVSWNAVKKRMIKIGLA